MEMEKNSHIKLLRGVWKFRVIDMTLKSKK